MTDTLQPPTDQTLVRLWETFKDKHPAVRAVALLAAARGADDETIARLDLATRDRQLTLLRIRMFGDDFEFKVRCSACETDMEFTAPGAKLLVDPPEEASGQVTVEGVEVRFRWPNSRDLIALAGAAEADTPRQLIERCLVGAIGPDGPVSRLSDAMIEAVVDALKAYTMRFDLTCPDCEAPCPTDLDISAYLWTEVDAHVKQRLSEVAELALRYGWSEQEILGMSPARRQLYLEMSDG